MKNLVFIFLFLIVNSVQAGPAQKLQIGQKFARAAIMQQRNSAVFMDIVNSGQDAQIVYARSPSATIVELHTHFNDNGIMRMRKINKIDLPSGQEVKLKPGGLHVMLLGLKQDLKVGGYVALTLGFADGSETLLQVPVRKMRMKMKNNGIKMNEGKPIMMVH